MKAGLLARCLRRCAPRARAAAGRAAAPPAPPLLARAARGPGGAAAGHHAAGRAAARQAERAAVPGRRSPTPRSRARIACRRKAALLPSFSDTTQFLGNSGEPGAGQRTVRVDRRRQHVPPVARRAPGDLAEHVHRTPLLKARGGGGAGLRPGSKSRSAASPSRSRGSTTRSSRRSANTPRAQERAAGGSASSTSRSSRSVSARSRAATS